MGADPVTTAPTWGSLIAAWRAEQGVSQYAIARSIGITRVSQRAIEQGTHEPSADTVRRYLDHAKLLHSLRGGDPEKQPAATRRLLEIAEIYPAAPATTTNDQP